MADSNQIGTAAAVVPDGVVTAYVYDRVSVARVGLMLFRAAANAKRAGVEDATAPVSHAVRQHLLEED